MIGNSQNSRGSRSSFREVAIGPRTDDQAALFGSSLVGCVPQLRRYAERGRASRHADDLVQETLLRALERRASFDGDRPLWPWLRRVYDHTAARRAEMEARVPIAGGNVSEIVARSSGEVDDGDHVAASLTAGPNAMEHAGPDPVLRSEVESWLSKLRGPEREVLERFYLQGLTVREISADLGVPEGTTKARLSRARRRLALLLGGGVLALTAAVFVPRFGGRISPAVSPPGPRSSSTGSGSAERGALIVLSASIEVREIHAAPPTFTRRDYVHPAPQRWVVTGAQVVSNPMLPVVLPR